MPETPETALVLFSGGQDSATCLAWALQRFAHVETVGFDYGQRHRVELACRDVFRERLTAAFPGWAARLGPDHLLDAGVLKSLGQTAMTEEVEIEMQANGLPSTFVPGRNLLFFTLAGVLALRRSASVLIGGMCETDYSGYPDCRAVTLKAQEKTLQLGLECDLIIEAPLMYIDKAGTWALAESLGGDTLVRLVTEHTHTCYLGDRTHRHAWGYGCGTCPACELRASGWDRWQAAR
jgi:7-cyano-7-deazaguanine synthase